MALYDVNDVCALYVNIDVLLSTERECVAELASDRFRPTTSRLEEHALSGETLVRTGSGLGACRCHVNLRST